MLTQLEKKNGSHSPQKHKIKCVDCAIQLEDLGHLTVLLNQPQKAILVKGVVRKPTHERNCNLSAMPVKESNLSLKL